MRPGVKMFFAGVVIAVLGATLHEVSEGYSVLQLASAAIIVGLGVMLIGGLIWFSHRKEPVPVDPFAIDAPAVEPKRTAERAVDAATPDKPAPKKLTPERALLAVWPWAMTALIAGVLINVASAVFDVSIAKMFAELGHALHLAVRRTPSEQELRTVMWKSPHALLLVSGGALVAWIGFHLQRRRTAALGFSQVKLVRVRGLGAYLSPLPTALRVLAVIALAIGLARPETYRIVRHEIDSVDIMIVMDMSKSMEETDMPHDRMDAAQRVIRRFLRRNKNDRIGLVIFGQQAMLQCPLTHDSKILEKIVADLVIGDVPELGTAIGDGLALAVAQLRRSDAKSKVVILLSDGDSNWVTRFDPDEAARVAQDSNIKVYTLLVGREESDLFGGMSVNPATLRSIAQRTGGEFFRASDYASFDRGFQTVRNQLDTTKRTVTERVPDQQLFVPFALLAAALVLLELLLSNTRLRRLP
jgi:Ca-activated chloride channel family protein